LLSRAGGTRPAVGRTYTSQTAGFDWDSTINTLPSSERARREVSSLAPLKKVVGLATLNREAPPYCSMHCSRFPEKQRTVFDWGNVITKPSSWKISTLYGMF